MADSPPAYAPAPAYHAAPVYKEEKLPPQPFAYEYGVADDYSKANFKKTESQDGNGVVTGSFVIALPDGRIQTTTYTADHHNGFIAEVTYEGTPVYPRAQGGIRPCPRLQGSRLCPSPCLQARCLIKARYSLSYILVCHHKEVSITEFLIFPM